jgi:hypothetical protein
MLDRDGRKLGAVELIAAMPCLVEIPPQWRDSFERVGPVPFAQADRRRYPRVYCRGKQNRAGLQCQSNLPKLRRAPQWHSVYLSNLSRDGIAFLHGESLFPREQAKLLLPNNQTVNIEIVCCRRVHDRCFEIGARITGRALTNAAALMVSQQSATPATDTDWSDEAEASGAALSK